MLELDQKAADLQRTVFRMKRNFEKKQKNIAREYSMDRKEGEKSCYITAAAWCHDTFASHTFANEVKYYLVV